MPGQLGFTHIAYPDDVAIVGLSFRIPSDERSSNQPGTPRQLASRFEDSIPGRPAPKARKFLDLELGARSLHLPDPDAQGPASRQRADTRGNKVNLQTTTVLLIRCLTAVLLPPWNIRSTPPLRLAAFAKQLMTTSLHVPEKSAQALLALLADVGKYSWAQNCRALDTEERKGDGVFNALSQSEEGSNPFATTVWEGEILRRHYCPKIRDAVKMMEKSIMSDR
ncbi:hypothetical protein NUW58_g7489 [Xylaria curta]|uniref:Uncharacterized protein n=1 Tax=Xylaria curta TaxID=42375 RepID=A0ACC1NIL8_9PEZI|nr:hypothetical protein NUW58_g7489 [Xylaria curta]